MNCEPVVLAILPLFGKCCKVKHIFLDVSIIICLISVSLIGQLQPPSPPSLVLQDLIAFILFPGFRHTF